MAGRTKRLAKAAVALAAGALMQKAVEQAVKSPRVRRRASELQKAAGKRARATGKVVGKRARATGKIVGKRAQATGKAAGRKVKQLIKAAR